MRAQERPLDYVLGTFRFQIPDFQRPFSWTTEHFDDLWSDLLIETAESTGTHFMGTVVIQVDPSDPRFATVWDGQQRLASIIILLGVLRDFLDAEGSPENVELARELHQYIVRGGILARSTQETLRLGGTDQKTFSALVIRRRGEEDKKLLDFFDGLTPRVKKTDWSPRVIEAYRFFQNQLEGLVAEAARGGANWKDRVVSISRTLLNRFEVILAETNDANDAFKTFQVLNDRGLGLSAADLLKNFFLSETDSEQDRRDAADAWEEMAQSLGGDSLPTFLRHFYMSRYGLVSRPRLYKTMLSLVTPSNGQPANTTPSQLLTDITENSSDYQRLIEPTTFHDVWGSPEPLESLLVLEGLGATQWTPLVLAAMMRGCHPSEVALLIRAAEALVVREVVVLGKNPNTFEKVFASAAQAIWRSAPTSEEARLQAVRTAVTSLVENMSSDELLTASFGELSMGAKRARTLLDALERTIQEERLGGVKPDHQVLDVEHIYPRTDRAGWPAKGTGGYVDSPDRNLIGNLTLLHLSANRSQKNAPFTQKQVRYRDSKLLLTSDLARDELTSWGIEEIEARQEQLMEVAQRRWPIPSIPDS